MEGGGGKRKMIRNAINRRFLMEMFLIQLYFVFELRNIMKLFSK